MDIGAIPNNKKSRRKGLKSNSSALFLCLKMPVMVAYLSYIQLFYHL